MKSGGKACSFPGSPSSHLRKDNFNHWRFLDHFRECGVRGGHRVSLRLHVSVPCLYSWGARSLGPVGCHRLAATGTESLSTLGWMQGSSETKRPLERRPVARKDGGVPLQVAACRVSGHSGQPFCGSRLGLCRTEWNEPRGEWPAPCKALLGDTGTGRESCLCLLLLKAEGPRVPAFLPSGTGGLLAAPSGL